MSVHEKIERLRVARDASVAVLASKGVDVPEVAGFEAFPGIIEGIEVGGNDEELLLILDGTITTFSNDFVTTTRRNALSYTSLTSVSLPNAISLGECTFDNCTGLASVNLPLVEAISGYVFRNCKSLESISLPSFINEGTLFGQFIGCTNLKNVDMPKVKKIMHSMFEGCTSLETLVLPSSMYEVQLYAFRGASALTALIIESEKVVTLLHVLAFQGTPIEAGTGYIYVPKALLSDEDSTKDYRRATNWITYAEQFRAIEDYPEICGGATE